MKKVILVMMVMVFCLSAVESFAQIGKDHETRTREAQDRRKRPGGDLYNSGPGYSSRSDFSYSPPSSYPEFVSDERFEEWCLGPICLSIYCENSNSVYAIVNKLKKSYIFTSSQEARITEAVKAYRAMTPEQKEIYSFMPSSLRQKFLQEVLATAPNTQEQTANAKAAEAEKEKAAKAAEAEKAKKAEAAAVTAAATAAYNRGKSFKDQKNWDSAIKEYTETIRLDPGYVKAYEARSYVYIMSKDFDRTIADCTEAIRLDPQRPTAYHNRGTAYYEKGNYDLALADYTESIRRDTKNASAYYWRGRIYEKKGDKANAEADFAKARELGYKW